MVSTVVNVGLDLVFVSVLHWGVAGLAAASAIAYTLSAATLFYRLTKTDSPVRLDPRKLRVDGAVLARIVRIGLPAGLQSAVFALANTIIQAGINSLGTEVMAASSAAMSLEYVFYNLLNSCRRRSQNSCSMVPSQACSKTLTTEAMFHSRSGSASKT